MSRPVVCETEEGVANVWPGGALSDEFDIPRGPHELSLWTRWASIEGKPTTLDFLLGDSPLASRAVTSTNWALLHVPFQSPGGHQLLTIRHGTSDGIKYPDLDLWVAGCGLDVAPAPVRQPWLVSPRSTLTRLATDMQYPPGSLADTNGTVTLWSNGSLITQVIVPGLHETQLMISATGQPCDGEWPVMRVSLDDEQLATLTVDLPLPHDYVIDTRIKRGSHRLLIQFMNDGRNDDRGEDRNLIVHEVRLVPTVKHAQNGP
jgi:hypothetical protein